MHPGDSAPSRPALPRRRRRPAALALSAAVAACALAPTTAIATWSIVAVDPMTREVGLAAASCIAGVEVVVGLVPGRAAVAAQAFSSLEGKAQLQTLLSAGQPPDSAIAAVATPEFDAPFGLPVYRLRQYGVAALPPAGGVASYTGSWTFDVAGARADRFVGVQGNLLRSEEVLDAALAGFLETGPASCPRTFAERLLVGLEAGAEAGGDRRCGAELAALSAVLAVASAGDAPKSPSIFLRALRPGEEQPSTAADLRRLFGSPEPGARGEGAVPRLRAAFDAWRGANPGVPRCGTGPAPDSAPTAPASE